MDICDKTVLLTIFDFALFYHMKLINNLQLKKIIKKILTKLNNYDIIYAE